MKYNYSLLVLALVSFYVGCNQYNMHDLYGTWHTVKVLEAGSPMQPNPKEISFIFKEDGSYTYNGTLAYQETGIFTLQGDLLLSRDTSKTDSKEKAVKILQLQGDSLKIEMLSNGKEQILHLVKS